MIVTENVAPVGSRGGHSALCNLLAWHYRTGPISGTLQLYRSMGQMPRSAYVVN